MTHLGHGSGEDNDFIQLADSLHELVNPGSLDDIDVVKLAFNLNRDREIGLM